MDITTLKQGSVIVGVDGSASSEAALAWAVDRATSTHRPLVLVHGAGDPRATVAFLGTEEARNVLLAEGRRVTDLALDKVRLSAPDLEVTVETPLTDARQALLERAELASIIVLGTRGRGPVRALLLGSVSAAVATHAPCPVAVVRASGAGEAAGGPVVVGVDGGPASTAALDFAFRLASERRRRLVVVHSWSTNDTFVDETSYQQRLERIEEHERLLSQALSGYAEKFPDVTVDRHLPDGGAAPSLVAMSETASVVIVGSRGRTGLRSLVGSVSRDVVERAHCTVVVVRS